MTTVAFDNPVYAAGEYIFEEQDDFTPFSALTGNVFEAGDVAAASINALVSLTVTVAEDGDVTAAAIGAPVTANISANVNEEGDAAKARILPPDYSEAFFTVDYANLNADSPFAGDLAYSALSIGDSFVHETETPEDGHTVSMTGDGVVSLSPISLPQDQTIDFYIWDATDETLGAQGTITVEAARFLTASQAELGDVQAATLTEALTANVSSSQTELGDSVAVNFQVLNQLLAAQTELGDQGVAAIDATQEAFITAAQVEDEEQTSAALQNLINLGATQSEEGDGTVAALAGSVVTNLTVSLVEDGDTVSASVSPLVSINVSQVELGDAQIASVAGPVRGGVFNIYGQFPSGNSVTITLYDPITGATVPLDSSTCWEFGTTGSYVWGTEQITTQPEGYQEYVWEMTDGLTTQGGLYKINEAARIAAAVNALTLAEWIALR